MLLLLTDASQGLWVTSANTVVVKGLYTFIMVFWGFDGFFEVFSVRSGMSVQET